MSGKVTRWWWVRHAPVVNHNGKIYGQSDIGCDVSDTPSFEGLAGKIPEGAVWVTSNLSRTIDTANAILKAGGPLPKDPEKPVVEPDFAEQSFGEWQNYSWDELHAAGVPDYNTFWENPGYNAPPGGESFADLIARASKAIERINTEYHGRDIVAVTHGGTIRAAVALALQIEPIMALAVQIDNLTLTRLEHVSDGLFKGQGGVWRIRGINLPPV
ncbi:MAG: histidine phosphatase family protein [Rhodospirillaceae bacterium]|jgi:alpha-ribazole phosphatase|nr:histidine phosphatase family protein [Rhodospirillaceae bacterium]